jgi:hypothetical protein
MKSVLSRVGVAVAAAVVAFVTIVGAAWAEAPTTICVPERASSQVLSTNAKGECPAKVISKTTVKYKAEALPGSAELEKLDKVLPHIKYVESGVGGKPTIQFFGVNVQVVSGEGKTSGPTNGEGNLVLGYDENAGNHEQTGSHNLVLGEEQTFSSYGGLLGGFKNAISGPFASVTGGSLNSAGSTYSSISGGESNTALAQSASVSGGENNTANNTWASVSGGVKNTASGVSASVSGGSKNTASGVRASISGGEQNKAVGEGGSVTGGKENEAGGSPVAWVGGGQLNWAAAEASAIFGGYFGYAGSKYEAIP